MEPTVSQAAQLYQAVKPATAATEPQAASNSGFGEAINDFATVLQANEQVAKDAMVGKADPQALVEALAQTQLAVETAVSIRDKIVEAYQEILRMPV